MTIQGVGIDIVEVARFSRFSKGVEDNFLYNNFTQVERTYCFSYKSPATHLAGTFAAKEAAFKASGKSSLLFSSFEIRRQKKGGPKVFIKGKWQKNILISISHTDTYAVAIAIKQ